MIDNSELLNQFLSFEEDDFLIVRILLRKKDHTSTESNKQSVRTIKTFVIESKEYFDSKYDEIKNLCEHFQARAYFYPHVLNHKKVGLKMIEEISIRLQNGHVNQSNVFDSVVGKLSPKSKVWVVDIDSLDEELIQHTSEVIKMIGGTVIVQIPTRSGVHLLTKPFNRIKFKELVPDKEIEIHTQNPTLLFFPKSLN